jgi:hypothetical protein
MLEGTGSPSPERIVGATSESIVGRAEAFPGGIQAGPQTISGTRTTSSWSVIAGSFRLRQPAGAAHHVGLAQPHDLRADLDDGV